MHSDDSDPAKNQSIENLKATIVEIEKTIAVEFDKESMAELERLKADLLKVLDGLEKNEGKI
jgi:hypothetical protein